MFLCFHEFHGLGFVYVLFCSILVVISSTPMRSEECRRDLAHRSVVTSSIWGFQSEPLGEFFLVALLGLAYLFFPLVLVICMKVTADRSRLSPRKVFKTPGVLTDTSRL